MSNRLTARILVCVVLAGAVLGACVTDGGEGGPEVTPRRPLASPTGTDTRVVGLVGSMSGEGMWRGEDAFEGADLAVHILNRTVQEGRPPFELVTLDDRGDPERAIELVERLAAAENTVGIVYAGPPEALPRAEPALTQAGIPALICYGDLYGARLLRPHIFQMSPSFLWQARTIARYAFRDRGYRRIGLVAARSLDGDVAVAGMKDAVRQFAGRRLFVRRYAEASRVDGVPRPFIERKVQAVVVQGQPGTFERLAGSRSGLQMISFDLGLGAGRGYPVGSVVSDTYARGAHLLPIPSFERFREAFREWWDGSDPLGWELRAYDAVRLIGWAAQRTSPDEDIASTLELVDGVRFGGLDITFGPDDHTAAEQQTVGLWVRPRSAFASLIPEDGLPWLPLARGFSIDGERTSILNRDWRYLFRDPPPPRAPAPRFRRMRYAVTSPRSDPVH